jgi:RNA polymerase sigma-70 factor (ECF subfamily)
MNETIDKYYRENYDLLVKRVKNRAGSPENAEDVVQEAFSRAIKYFNSCSSNFDRWFSVILSNTLKDYQKELRLGGLTKNIDDAINELEPIIPNHIKDHFRAHMDQLANAKTSCSKEVIKLHILYGYTSKEIAEILGLSNGYVKNNISLFTKEVGEMYG